MSDVSTTTSAHTQAVDRARLPRTLMGGTMSMRAQGEAYLPRYAAETHEAYKARKKRSFLFNAFLKTVNDMTGKVFSRPLVLKDDVPNALLGYAENIDLTGRHINVFARDVFRDAMQTGIAFILTDAPVRPEDARTRADTIAAGVRPYLIHVCVENLLGWKSEMRGGVETLTQIRIRECVSEPDPSNEFQDREVEQIRLIEPGIWQTWRKNGQTGEWAVHQAGTFGLDFIPLAPVYLHRVAFMTGAPPLGELADLNVAHWQSSSDQRNLLHVARVPILFGAGFKEEAIIEVGASSMVRTSDTGATLQYVEHAGQAIGSGQKDIEHLEFQMQQCGLQLLVPNPGQTATGEIRDNVKENSPLAMMALALQDALEMSLGFMAQFEGLGPDKGGSVEAIRTSA